MEWESGGYGKPPYDYDHSGVQRLAAASILGDL